MDISKGNIIRINHGFGGSLRNDASLDFALDKQNNKKLGEYKKLAYLIRAILVDHPFTDGNKRTAIFVCFAFSYEFDKMVDNDLLKHHMVSIAMKNEQIIKNIEWRLKLAIK